MRLALHRVARIGPGRSLLRGAAALAAVLLAPCFAIGQFDAPDSLSPVFSRQRRFAIPYHVDPSPNAAAPHQVQLHVSDDGGANWRLYVALPPERGRFVFEAPADGDFLFLVRSVDEVGRTRPGAANRPELRVVVDSQAPTAELAAERTADGQIEVAWSADDAHLDGATYLLRYRASGGETWNEQPLTTDAVAAGAKLRIQPDAAWPAAELQLEVVDSAGNRTLTSRVVPLRRDPPRPVGLGDVGGRDSVMRLPPTGGATAIHAGGRGAATNAVSDRFSPPPPAEVRWTRSGEDRIVESESQSWAPRLASSSTRVAATTNELHASRTFETETVPTPEPVLPPEPATREAGYRAANETQTEPRGDAVENRSDEAVVFPDPSDFENDADGPSESTDQYDSGPAWDFPALPEERTPSTAEDDVTVNDSDVSTESADWPPRWDDERPRSAPEPTSADGDVVYVRTPQVSVEYAVEAPHGELAEVEIWGAVDEADDWRLYGVDDDLQSPAVVELKAPGRHGLRIVAADSRGWSSGRPESGAAADVWIDYDPTPPHVRLLRAEIEASGEVVVYWEAADRRLAEQPITILVAEDRRGPWRKIAESLDNTGEYRWTIPDDVPPKIYFKIEARDAAGNLGEDAAGRPIPLEHLRPRATIQGVRAADLRNRRTVHLF